MSLTYETKHDALLDQIRAQDRRVPADIWKAVCAYRNAEIETADLPEDEKNEYVNMLIVSDSIICDSLERFLQANNDTGRVNKIKLMAMKAKALKLKLNQLI